jgi:chromosome segregation ATPase
MDAQQSQNLQSQLSEMAVQLQASDEAIEDVQARNQELESRCADLQQDLEIAQKELEYSKIEQAQLNSVIQNQQTRISALENLDVQKNQKIEEMKQMEEEIREQLENFKAGPSQTSSQRSLREAPEDNRMLLIEENTKLRSKERESTK